MWAQETMCYTGLRSPMGREILGVVQPIEKHWESLLQCTQSKRDRSVLNNCMTCNVACCQIL